MLGKIVDHCAYLQQAFNLLWYFGMKLNSAKCAFNMSTGKFLGFLVTERGGIGNASDLKEATLLLSGAPVGHLDIWSDSQLVVNQVQGEYEARDVRMMRYLEKITSEENAQTDALAEANGQTKTTNKSLLDMLKKRLQEAGNTGWKSVKPRETHFCLAYGMEAIIPTKVGMPIL
ncbi:hypothetical protein AAG906_025827 [Vitis piasezkii]